MPVITRQRGYFVSGKFDLLQQNVPFSALVTALQDLVQQLLTEGLVLTIEPIIGAGGREVVDDADDGWTIRTRDGARSAHAEHTIVITSGEPLVLTAS